MLRRRSIYAANWRETVSLLSGKGHAGFMQGHKVHTENHVSTNSRKVDPQMGVFFLPAGPEFLNFMTLSHNLTISQSPHNLLTISSQSSHNHLTIISPSSHNHLTIISPSSHHHLTIISPSSHHHLTTISPSISPPSHHHLTTISPPSHHHLTTISPPSHHHLTTTTSPSHHDLLTTSSRPPHDLLAGLCQNLRISWFCTCGAWRGGNHALEHSTPTTMSHGKSSPFFLIVVF